MLSRLEPSDRTATAIGAKTALGNRMIHERRVKMRFRRRICPKTGIVIELVGKEAPGMTSMDPLRSRAVIREDQADRHGPSDDPWQPGLFSSVWLEPIPFGYPETTQDQQDRIRGQTNRVTVDDRKNSLPTLVAPSPIIRCISKQNLTQLLAINPFPAVCNHSTVSRPRAGQFCPVCTSGSDLAYG